MNEKNILGVTADGVKIVDRHNSHVHFENGISLELINAALRKVRVGGKKFATYTVSFDRIIGKSACVAVDERDEIVLVQRKGRMGITPMVKNREGVDTNKLTFAILQNEGEGVLITAYVGDKSEKEPWDKNIKTPEEKMSAILFWRNHALLYDESQIAQ